MTKLAAFSVLLLASNLMASQAEMIEVSGAKQVVRVATVNGSELVENAEDFDFLHCQPIQGDEKKLAVHYVIKMDNYEAKKLFITSAVGETKARELKNLAVVSEELSSTEGENQDLGFSSGQMWLRFSLTIRDSDGQYLEGTLFDKSQQVPIKCSDVTLE